MVACASVLLLEKSVITVMTVTTAQKSIENDLRNDPKPLAFSDFLVNKNVYLDFKVNRALDHSHYGRNDILTAQKSIGEKPEWRSLPSDRFEVGKLLCLS